MLISVCCASLAWYWPRAQLAFDPQRVWQQLPEDIWYGVYQDERKIGVAHMQHVLDTDSYRVETNIWIGQGDARTQWRLLNRYARLPPHLLIDTQRSKTRHGQTLPLASERGVPMRLDQHLATERALLQHSSSVQVNAAWQASEIEGAADGWQVQYTGDRAMLNNGLLNATYAVDGQTLTLVSMDLGQRTRLQMLAPEDAFTGIINPSADDPVAVSYVTHDLRRADTFVLSASGEFATLLPSTGQQQVQRRDGKWFIQMTPRAPPRAQPALGTPSPLDRFRVPSADLPSDLPEIAAIASVAIEPFSAPIDRLRALMWSTRGRLTYSASATPVSVRQALRQGAGDCTEFSGLFVSLARSAGFAARIASGLIYDGKRSFALHAWAEVWLDDHWLTVDPTFGELPAHTPRIRFSDDPTALVRMFDVLPRTSLRVESYGAVDPEPRRE